METIIKGIFAFNSTNVDDIFLLTLYFGNDDKKNVISEIQKNAGVLAVASVTFANGGDNIGIYIPLPATLFLSEKLTVVLIFLVMTIVWCWIGKYLSSHKLIVRVIERSGHIVMPLILIALGINIIFESKSLYFLKLTDRN